MISSESIGQPHERKIIIILIHKVVGIEIERLIYNFFSNEMKTTTTKSDTKIVKKLWSIAVIRLASKIISNEIQLVIWLKEDSVV